MYLIGFAGWSCVAAEVELHLNEREDVWMFLTTDVTMNLCWLNVDPILGVEPGSPGWKQEPWPLAHMGLVYLYLNDSRYSWCQHVQHGNQWPSSYRFIWGLTCGTAPPAGEDADCLRTDHHRRDSGLVLLDFLSHHRRRAESVFTTTGTKVQIFSLQL